MLEPISTQPVVDAVLKARALNSLRRFAEAKNELSRLDLSKIKSKTGPLWLMAKAEYGLGNVGRARELLIQLMQYSSKLDISVAASLISLMPKEDPLIPFLRGMFDEQEWAAIQYFVNRKGGISFDDIGDEQFEAVSGLQDNNIWDGGYDVPIDGAAVKELRPVTKYKKTER